MACGFGAISFSLEEQIHIEFCHYALVYLAEAGIRTETSRSYASLGAGISYLESPSLSTSLYLAECGRCLQGQGAIVAELGSSLTKFFQLG